MHDRWHGPIRRHCVCDILLVHALFSIIGILPNLRSPACHAIHKQAYRKRGAHWTFNAEKFVAALKHMRAAGCGSFPSFDHCVGDPIEDDVHVQASDKTVIVEGNYVLLSDVPPWNAAAECFDEAWLLDCPLDVCAERVYNRHLGTGLDAQTARARVRENDTPNGQFILDQLDRSKLSKTISCTH